MAAAGAAQQHGVSGAPRRPMQDERLGADRPAQNQARHARASPRGPVGSGVHVLGHEQPCECVGALARDCPIASWAILGARRYADE
eukprot:3278078-Pyramimonas_sp.AAC.1